MIDGLTKRRGTIPVDMKAFMELKRVYRARLTDDTTTSADVVEAVGKLLEAERPYE